MRTIKFNETVDGKIDKMVKKDKKFDDYCDYRSNHFKNYRNEHKDIFNFLNKSNPDFTGDNDLLEQFLKSDNETIKKIKNSCKGSDTMSYLMSKELIKQFESILLTNFKDLSEQQNSSKGSEANKLQKNDFKQAMKKNKLKMNLAIRKASSEMKKELKKAETLQSIIKSASNGSGDNGMSESKVDIDTVLNLYERIKNNPEIAKLMELIGKMQNTAKHKLNTTIKGGSQELVGIEFGSDLQNVLPEEIAMLDMPEFADLKILDYIEETMVQYEHQDKKPKSKGNVIVLLDESGSMYGQRINTCYAYLFGLYQIAQANKSKMKVIKFSTHGRFKTIEITGIDSLLQCISIFLDGGTDFDTPIQEAMKEVEIGAGYETADIIMITDGYGSISKQTIEAMNEVKKTIKLKFISFVMGYGDNPELAKISDRIVFSNDISKLVDATYKEN